VNSSGSLRFVFIVHYFPPINSSGAKRVEAISKYLVMAGHHVTVITTRKSVSDGEFTEDIPPGVELIELDALGRDRSSAKGDGVFEPMYIGKRSWKRILKDFVMEAGGQLPDPRLPFAISFLNPWLTPRVQTAIQQANIVIGSTPPWPMLLAALIVKWRFGVRCILDYRDQLSECHEMPGSYLAKKLEKMVDRWLVASADQVVTISEPMASFYRKMTDRIAVILNGYDDAVIDAARLQATPSRDRIVIRYMGLVSPGRVPHRFFKALTMFKEEQPERFASLRVEFFGNAALIERALVDQYPTIREIFGFFPSVPYVTSLQRIVEADYLLFGETSSKTTLSAQGILTTKLFEYIGSGRPVLADISRDTLAGSLLLSCGDRHTVGAVPDVFLETLRSDAFYHRLPDTVSEKGRSLSRRAQADQYAQLAMAVVGRA
jgi:glycosyltransferase involved in cell wall biosynthesis